MLSGVGFGVRPRMLSRPLLKRNSKIVVFPVLSNHSYPMPQPARMNRLENSFAHEAPAFAHLFRGLHPFLKNGPEGSGPHSKTRPCHAGRPPKSKELASCLASS